LKITNTCVLGRNLLNNLYKADKVYKMISKGNDLQEKKLRGSGGYVYAKVTDDEQRRGNLGGPDLFLAGIGRLDEKRFSKYYCNKCEREYEGSPMVNYENPNEQLGEGVTLIEKGEYICKTCNNVLAQYRKFDTPTANSKTSMVEDKSVSKIQSSIPNNDIVSPDGLSQQPTNLSLASSSIDNTDIHNASSMTKTATSATQQGFIPIQSLVGMPAYDSDATLIGTIKEIGLRRLSPGHMQITIRVSKNMNDNVSQSSFNQIDEVMWNDISKIGDVLILASSATKTKAISNNLSSNKLKCPSCGYQNEDGAVFCEECGTKLI
jgi:sporulation protein YlmC with PRC-barrel domain